MRLRSIAIILSVIFGLIIQATILAELNLFGVGIKPDLVLIIAVTFGLLKGPWYGGIIGLCAGLLADLFTGGILGIGAAARMIVGFGAGLLEKLIFKDNLLMPALALLAGTVVNEAVYLLLHGAFSQDMGSFGHIIIRIFLIAITNGLLAPFIYRQFYRMELRLAAD